ncbi:hypothetical protein PsYK624_096640 [Phanerochaete sordida]|uniref:BTB domain-containing protein n=1 Tax=Phanerochaete sordida TaxID=48140 RepID=A0A9P3LFP8_9APHY|nr:hypothetical protein PsYK624_096640 [Phanerochaete sordida]
MAEVAREERRHPRLYKATGDLVISAISEDVTHIFRVHAVVIAEHSPVFSGMLSLPVEDAAAQKYDGVPIVHLPDNAKDVGALLEYLYTLESSVLNAAGRTWAAEAYALMAIANKYQVDSVCTALTNCLKAQWPTTLVEFIEAKTRKPPSELFYSEAAQSPREPASAIRLATDFNIPEVLPSAYYELAMHDITTGSTNLIRWNLLRPEELLRYYQGKRRLERRFAFSAAVYDPPNLQEWCETLFSDYDWYEGDPRESSVCRREMASAKKKWEGKFGDSITNFEAMRRADPIQAILEIYEEDKNNVKFCALCSNDFRTDCRRAIERVWGSLPAAFSLVRVFISAVITVSLVLPVYL